MYKITTICIAICVSFSLCAQQPNPKREVLLTLGDYERIYENKFFVSQVANQNRFACIVEDTDNGRRAFVFNGENIAESNIRLDVPYLNTNEENGYICIYRYGGRGSFSSHWYQDDLFSHSYICLNHKGTLYEYLEDVDLDEDNPDIFCYSTIEGAIKGEEQLNYYVHYNGNIAGPFDDVSLKPEKKIGGIYSFTYYFTTTDKNYDYYFKQNGKWYGSKNSKNKEVNFAEYYQEGNRYDSKYYVNINGNVSQLYDEVCYILHLTENGHYAYVYRDNGKYYVNINGNISQAYNSVEYDCLLLTKSGKYAYKYTDNGKYYVNINGENSQGYEMINGLKLLENGKYCYYIGKGYKCDNPDSLKFYANINGEISSRGYNFIYEIFLTEDGQYAYKCRNNREYDYVNIDGQSSQGSLITSFFFTENGQYAYDCRSGDNRYVNINGNLSQAYYNVYGLRLTESGNYAYIYNTMGKGYGININGKLVQVKERIDDENFYITENGQYAYIYFDSDTRKYYINMNGNIYGGYDEISDLELSDNGNYFYKYNIGDGRLYHNKNGKITNMEFLTVDLDYGRSYYSQDDEDDSEEDEDDSEEDNDSSENDNEEDNGNIRYCPEIHLYSTNKEYSLHSDSNYEYVIIDNIHSGSKHLGRSPARSAWYDSEKNAFIWNTIEDKELVIYEYKLP